jgi:LysM repeat protein
MRPVLYCFIAFSAVFASLQAQKLNTVDYINEYKFAAMQEMKVYSVPASVTLAQGILESASGNSKLAKDCNNHFGIKCRKNWTGNFCLADDDAPDECFRGYSSAMESYRDHSLFLKGNSRYDFLFAMPATDYKAWSHGLRQAGYATNPAYGSILIGVIERYRLSMYDSMVILGDDYDTPDTAAGNLIRVKGLPAVYARKGQTAADIAKEQDMGVWQIYKYNDLKNGEELRPGEIIYLKPKRRKSSDQIHVVQDGETLRDISQQHAIKLKQLQKYNHVKPGQDLRPGERLYLMQKREDQDKAEQGKTKNNADTGQVAPETTKKTIPEAKVGEGKGNSPAEHDVPKPNLSYHIVMKGETVFSISRLYKISADSLMVWNHIVNSQIGLGQELRIANTALVSKSLENKLHKVSAGETLYQISRKYQVSVDALRLKNQLGSNEIKVGQQLLIP